MSVALIYLIVALSVFRVTRLITRDSILDVPRAWVAGRLKSGGYLDELFHCPWCISFWVGLVATLLVRHWPVGTAIVATPFAFSAVAGLLDRLDRS